MDNFNIPPNIYIDLSKAFDTLNFDILLNKLCNCQSSTRAVRVLDGSQQKADVVKTDYSNSLLMITKM